MIKIVVQTLQGAPVGVPLSAAFGPEGGTIGRASNNTLVLEDPDRTVSRVHAQIICRGGSWVIVDRGSNPTQLNGQPIGAGNESAIKPGDRLQLGSYELLVSQAGGDAVGPAANAPGASASPAADQADDPFSHLLDGLLEPGSSPAPAAPRPAAPDPTAGLFPDPLGAAPSPAGNDPFAGLSLAGDAPAPSSDGLSGLMGSPGGSAQSIDALFGLGGPLGNNPLADPLLQPNTASGQDPLAALSKPAAPTPEARSDHVPVDAFGFVPPVAHGVKPSSATPAAPRALAPMPPPPPPPGAADPFAGLDLGLQAPAPSTEGDDDPPTPPIPLAAAGTGVPATALPPLAAPADVPVLVQPVQVPAGGGDALLAAFLQGVGPLQKPVDALTPALMQRVGELLRTATEGTLQLLHTRQEFKQEVRAQVTLIAAQANNPLKFSPTVEVALAHLLGSGVRGFMPAEAAMRDAYQDLRAHEFGVMVGMRAALEHVIEQFEPGALEENIATKSRLDAIFSANRKARLWDQFVKLYAEIAREAEDDFHSLFGKAFLKAYEEQMQRLKAADAQGASHAG